MKSLKFYVLVVPMLVLLTSCGMVGKKSQDELVITEPEAVPQIQSTLKDGETLWEFSERTTGSGFNWERIAELNLIEDEKKVDAGLVLLVPPELALDELKNQ